MTTREVPALRAREVLTATLRVSEGDEIVVEVAVAGIGVRALGPDVFEALVAARRVLEQHGILLGCNGSRRDTFPSPMLRQADRGRHAYVCTLPRRSTRPEVVDVREPAPDLRLVTTVDEQRAWFDLWRRSPLDDASSQPPSNDLPEGLLDEARSHPSGWVYEIVGDYDPDGAIPPSAIRGGWPVDENGRPAGAFVPNPNFVAPRG